MALNNIVEISENGRHLSLFRGFLRILDDRQELGRVVLDDMTALVLSAQQISLSKNIMVALAERSIPIIICGKNWHPISICNSVSGHHEGAGVLYDQIESTTALRKRLWQKIIKKKIYNQALILERHTGKTNDVVLLKKMSKQVRSGDTDNKEARAAKLYWKSLMGKEFKRDYNSLNQNILLNYGYTILRAATARAVTATGLHPAIGVFHRNRNNPFCLVDDVMEPFRPIVDDVVYRLWQKYGDNFSDLTPEIKQELVAVLSLDLIGEKGMTPLVNALARVAQTLKESFQEKENHLILPDIVAVGSLL